MGEWARQALPRGHPERDGWEPTQRRGKRRRGKRCATGLVTHMDMGGGKLWKVWGGGWRCYGRCERGQDYCIHCRTGRFRGPGSPHPVTAAANG